MDIIELTFVWKTPITPISSTMQRKTRISMLHSVDEWRRKRLLMIHGAFPSMRVYA